jgi:hypothetical protein
MESSASAGRVASAVLDPRRWWNPLAALTQGYQSAFLACALLAGIGLAPAFLLPGRPRKPAHERPEPEPAPDADAAAAGDVVIRSGTT